MKHDLIIALTMLALTSQAQDKYKQVNFNKLTDVKGTEFVVASKDSWEKVSGTKSNYLLFINTTTGQTNQVDFSNDARVARLEQVKLDTLKINLIISLVRTTDVDGKNGIDWNDPAQIFILSTDGKDKIQLTENTFFTGTWAINRKTGTIVVTGYYDSNNNGKYDRGDKNEIQIFDLRTRKLKSRI